MERPQAHEPKEIKFPYKNSLWSLTNTSQPSCLGVNYIRPMQSMWENCEPQTYSHLMWVRSKKLYLEAQEVLEIFSEVSKTCCETANKALNVINNRAIQFVKEGNISKIARENMRKPSLLEGCTDWHVATDLKHNFIFPTEIALITRRPDIVIWSVKAKKFSLLS